LSHNQQVSTQYEMLRAELASGGPTGIGRVPQAQDVRHSAFNGLRRSSTECEPSCRSATRPADGPPAGMLFTSLKFKVGASVQRGQTWSAENERVFTISDTLSTIPPCTSVRYMYYVRHLE